MGDTFCKYVKLVGDALGRDVTVNERVKFVAATLDGEKTLGDASMLRDQRKARGVRRRRLRAGRLRRRWCARCDGASDPVVRRRCRMQEASSARLYREPAEPARKLLQGGCELAAQSIPAMRNGPVRPLPQS
jgi:hypothetical protein